MWNQIFHFQNQLSQFQMTSTSNEGESMAHKPICQDIKADQEHVFHYQVDAAEVKHSNSYIREE